MEYVVNLQQKVTFKLMQLNPQLTTVMPLASLMKTESVIC